MFSTLGSYVWGLEAKSFRGSKQSSPRIPVAVVQPANWREREQPTQTGRPAFPGNVSQHSSDSPTDDGLFPRRRSLLSRGHSPKIKRPVSVWSLASSRLWPASDEEEKKRTLWFCPQNQARERMKFKKIGDGRKIRNKRATRNEATAGLFEPIALLPGGCRCYLDSTVYRCSGLSKALSPVAHFRYLCVPKRVRAKQTQKSKKNE